MPRRSSSSAGTSSRRALAALRACTRKLAAYAARQLREPSTRRHALRQRRSRALIGTIEMHANSAKSLNRTARDGIHGCSASSAWGTSPRSRPAPADAPCTCNRRVASRVRCGQPELWRRVRIGVVSRKATLLREHHHRCEALGGASGRLGCPGARRRRASPRCVKQPLAVATRTGCSGGEAAAQRRAQADERVMGVILTRPITVRGADEVRPGAPTPIR